MVCVRIKHLCNTQQLSRILVGGFQNNHLQHKHARWYISQRFRAVLIHEGLIYQAGTYQIVKVLADLSDDSGEGGSEQLLNVVGPRAVPVVGLQVVNPLKKREEGIEEGWQPELKSRSVTTRNYF